MFVWLSCLTSVTSVEIDFQCEIFDEFFLVRSESLRHECRPCANSSKTLVLSCTVQNLTCSQEFQPRVPTSSVQLHVSPATAVSNATRCLCPFQLWQVVQGTRRRLHHHHFLVLRSLVVSIHCVCVERLHTHLQCQEVCHTTRRVRRTRRK